MKANSSTNSEPALARWFPALGWLRGDVVAGVTLAAYLLPSGFGRGFHIGETVVLVHTQALAVSLDKVDKKSAK